MVGNFLVKVFSVVKPILLKNFQRKYSPKIVRVKIFEHKNSDDF